MPGTCSSAFSETSFSGDTGKGEGRGIPVSGPAVPPLDTAAPGGRAARGAGRAAGRGPFALAAVPSIARTITDVRLTGGGEGSSFNPPVTLSMRASWYASVALRSAPKNFLLKLAVSAYS